MSLSRVLAIPLAVCHFLWWLISWCVYVFTLPLRLMISYMISFPILSLTLIVIIFSIIYMIRQLTKSDPIQFLLYTVLPWLGAFIYSILSLFVPQIDMFKKIFHLFFHPIQFFLNLFAKVNERAERVRDMVDVLGPRTVTDQRRTKSSRLMCYKCKRREKTCLLTPCNHFCMCEPCYDGMVSRGEPKCPQCQQSVDSFIKIEL